MARFNEILVGRFNRAVQKLLSMKGPAALVTVSDEMMPIIKMADLTAVEDRYLMSWNRFGVFVGQAAGGVGTFADFRFRNPAASNVVAVFERIFFFPSAGNLADAPQLATGSLAADLGTAVSLATASLDARTSPGSALTASRGTPTGTSVPAKFEISFTATIGGGDFIWDVDHEIPLFPGWALEVISNVANQGSTCSFLWRERFLEESERA